MNESHAILLVSALSIGLIHTVIGPDHYLPFIVLGRAEGWTLRKTMLWTLVCGLGHVLSSIAIGLLGVALGWALSSMERFEGIRGHLAGIALIGFGLIYFLWGLWRGRRGHSHLHKHSDGSLHAHAHPHTRPSQERDHEEAPHEEPSHVARHQRTLWVLFMIFVLGPCEPLIPLLMAPASRHDTLGVLLVAGLFSVVTIGTMMILVLIGTFGLHLVRIRMLEQYAHALAGFAILVSGLLIQLLGV
jgi:nickel/cobalt transporter (NicO) family protein